MLALDLIRSMLSPIQVEEREKQTQLRTRNKFNHSMTTMLEKKYNSGQIADGIQYNTMNEKQTERMQLPHLSSVKFKELMGGELYKPPIIASKLVQQFQNNNTVQNFKKGRLYQTVDIS